MTCKRTYRYRMMREFECQNLLEDDRRHNDIALFRCDLKQVCPCKLGKDIYDINYQHTCCEDPKCFYGIVRYDTVVHVHRKERCCKYKEVDQDRSKKRIFVDGCREFERMPEPVFVLQMQGLVIVIFMLKVFFDHKTVADILIFKNIYIYPLRNRIFSRHDDLGFGFIFIKGFEYAGSLI